MIRAAARRNNADVEANGPSAAGEETIQQQQQQQQQNQMSPNKEAISLDVHQESSIDNKEMVGAGVEITNGRGNRKDRHGPFFVRYFLRRWRSWDAIDRINFLLVVAIVILLIPSLLLNMANAITDTEEAMENSVSKSIDEAKPAVGGGGNAVAKDEAAEAELEEELENIFRPKPSSDAKAVADAIATSINTKTERPPDCSETDLFRIQMNGLKPDRCFTKTPWMRKCSLSQQTTCHHATWLRDFTSLARLEETTSLLMNDDGDFLGLMVGCTSGFSSVSVMRLFTGDHTFSKDTWAVASGSEPDRCDDFAFVEERKSRRLDAEEDDGEDDDDKDPLQTTDQEPDDLDPTDEQDEGDVESQSSGVIRKGSVVCIDSEAVTSKISAAAAKSGLDVKGLLTHTASLEDNPKQGIDHYMKMSGREGKFVDILSIDMQGNGFNVMLNAPLTLARTRYLEFEYEWKGAWAEQKLKHAILYLDDLGFTCYWAGRGRLWRITGCYQDYYDFHTWSYVACSNRNLAPKLSMKMEWLYRSTIGKR